MSADSDLSTEPGSSTESDSSIEFDLSTTVLESDDETYGDPVYGKSISVQVQSIKYNVMFPSTFCVYLRNIMASAIRF